MPNIAVSKKSLEPPAKLPGGIYEFIVKGFKPSWTKDKEGKTKTVNLQPQLNVINNPNNEFNGKPIYEYLNQQAGWVQIDFVHSLGLEMVDDGDNVVMPGDFVGPDADPAQWQYNGPIVGATGQVELINIKGQKGQDLTVIKRYFCKVPGCQHQHSENLAK